MRPDVVKSIKQVDEEQQKKKAPKPGGANDLPHQLG
jgi:hypothetical protein